MIFLDILPIYLLHCLDTLPISMILILYFCSPFCPFWSVSGVCPSQVSPATCFAPLVGVLPVFSSSQSPRQAQSIWPSRFQIGQHLANDHNQLPLFVYSTNPMSFGCIGLGPLGSGAFVFPGIDLRVSGPFLKPLQTRTGKRYATSNLVYR